MFEGLVIAKNNGGSVAPSPYERFPYGQAERIFAALSRVESVEVVRRSGAQGQAYHIRDKVGKKAKVKELIRKKNA